MTTLSQLERTFSISDSFVSMIDDSIVDTTGTTGTGTSTSTGTTGTSASTSNTGTSAGTATTSITTAAQKTDTLIISGSGEIGKSLTANDALLYEKDGKGPMSYQWQRQGVDIPKATKNTYKLTKDDYGKAITLKVSYDTLKSVKVVKVSNTIIALVFAAPPAAASTLTNQLTISGVGEVGQTLTGDVSQLYDNNEMGPLTYQWQRQGVDIPSATKKTYKLTKDDYGKTIKLKVSYMNKKAITVVKESNLIIVMHGSFINDVVEFKLSWQTLYIPKTITPKNITTYEKLDAVLLFYNVDGNCVKLVKLSDPSCSTTKITSLDTVGPLPDYTTVDKDVNVKSNIVTYQVDFPKLDTKYTKVVYCVCEVATPPNISILSTDLYPKASWASSADITKNITVTGTTSAFKSVFNNKGLFVLDINTLGNTKYPKSTITFGEEKRLKSAGTDSKERLCVFCVFTRSPDNAGWYVEKQYKLKTQLKGAVPLDYLKPVSKFTDLGL